MTVIDLHKAQAELPALIDELAPGEEVTITRDGVPVAKLTAAAKAAAGKRQPGLWKGKAVILAEDDEHLQDFAEYMT